MVCKLVIESRHKYRIYFYIKQVIIELYSI
nr:MAG TPA: hypothetical protein [Caudoviricetes sp.]